MWKQIVFGIVPNVFNILTAATLLATILSCEDFVEIDTPENQLVSDTVFEEDETAISALTGIYGSWSAGTFSFISGGASFSLLSGLSADEFTNFSQSSDQVEFFLNQLQSENGTILSKWIELYNSIFTANSVLFGLENSDAISPEVKSELEGEAKFIRAFCYFYLVNFWGDVPLALSPSFQENSVLSNSTEQEVYEQIINDLIDAQNLLEADYVTSERIRPNRFTAKSLLARVYLFIGDWENAEFEATEVINSGLYELQTDLNGVFLRGSNEAIWQLQSTVNGVNTWDGIFFRIQSIPNNVAIREEFINEFEFDDRRASDWIGTFSDGSSTWYFPFKYKVFVAPGEPSEYLTPLRFAEQYLIRSEALAQQGRILESQDDLNILRNRSGLANIDVSNQNSLLLAIEQERKFELFSEFGHRWLDLKRTGRADMVLASIKDGWQSTDLLYPIPQSEIIKNNNLQQNPGY